MKCDLNLYFSSL